MVLNIADGHPASVHNNHVIDVSQTARAFEVP